jgi:hypothetical protein
MKHHALPYLLVLLEDEKSDWFKMKNMLIYAAKIMNKHGGSLRFAFKRA